MEYKIWIKILLWAAIWVSIAPAIGQSNTFIKSFRLHDQSKSETGWSVFSHQNALYVNTGAICNSRSCAFYARVGDNGKIEWKRAHLWTDSANFNSFAASENRLYIGSHSNTNDLFYYLMLLNLDSGDSIGICSFDLSKVSKNFVGLNGILKFKNDIILYGESPGINVRANGIFVKSGLDCKIEKQQIYELQSDNQKGVVRTMDLQPDSTGHLVYITQTVKNFVEYSVIRKVNQDGEIIRELQIEAGSNQNSHLPIMTVDAKGNYVLEHRIKIDRYNHVQLLCIDTLGNKVWDFTKLDLNAGPDQPDRYNYSKIKGTADGGVIAVGLVQSYTFQDMRHEDAYVLKLDKNGKKEWERRINFVDDNDTLLDRCGLLDVVETEDGGYAALGYHSYSHSLGLKESLLVRMDHNGCVAGYDCGVDTMIVRSSLVSVSDTNNILSKVNVFPNPFYDQLNISDISLAIKQVYITDLMGNEVYKNNTDAATETLQVDGASWPSGLYILSGRDMYGHMVDRKKIIKY